MTELNQQELNQQELNQQEILKQCSIIVKNIRHNFIKKCESGGGQTKDISDLEIESLFQDFENKFKIDRMEIQMYCLYCKTSITSFLNEVNLKLSYLKGYGKDVDLEKYVAKEQTIEERVIGVSSKLKSFFETLDKLFYLTYHKQKRLENRSTKRKKPDTVEHTDINSRPFHIIYENNRDAVKTISTRPAGGDSSIQKKRRKKQFEDMRNDFKLQAKPVVILDRLSAKEIEQHMTTDNQSHFVTSKRRKTFKYQRKDRRILSSAYKKAEQETDTNEENSTCPCYVQNMQKDETLKSIENDNNLKEPSVILSSHPHISAEEVNITTCKYTTEANTGADKIPSILDKVKITSCEPIYTQHSVDSTVEGSKITKLFNKTSVAKVNECYVQVKAFEESSHGKTHILNEVETKKSMDVIQHVESSMGLNDNQDMLTNSSINKTLHNDTSNGEGINGDDHLHFVESKTNKCCNYQKEDERRLTSSGKMDDRETDKNETTTIICGMQNYETLSSIEYMTKKYNLKDVNLILHKYQGININEVSGTSIKITTDCNSDASKLSQKLVIKQITANNTIYAKYCDDPAIEETNILENTSSPQTRDSNTSVRGKNNSDIQVPIGNESKLHRSERKRSTRRNNAEQLNNENAHTSKKLDPAEKGKSANKRSSFHLCDINLSNATEYKNNEKQNKEKQKLYDKYSGDENSSNIKKVLESTYATQPPDTSAYVSKVNNCEIRESSREIFRETLKIDLPNLKEQFNDEVKFNNQKVKVINVVHRVEKERENENNFIGNSKLQELDDDNIANRPVSILQSCDTSTSNVTEEKVIEENSPDKVIMTFKESVNSDVFVLNECEALDLTVKKKEVSFPLKLNTPQEENIDLDDKVLGDSMTSCNVDKVFENTSVTQPTDINTSATKLYYRDIKAPGVTVRNTRQSQRKRKEQFNDEDKLNNQKEILTRDAHKVEKESQKVEDCIENFKLKEADDSNIAIRLCPTFRSHDINASNVAEKKINEIIIEDKQELSNEVIGVENGAHNEIQTTKDDTFIEDHNGIKKSDISSALKTVGFETSQIEEISSENRVLGCSADNSNIAIMLENTSASDTRETKTSTRKVNKYYFQDPFGTVKKILRNHRMRKNKLNSTKRLANKKENSFSYADTENKISPQLKKSKFESTDNNGGNRQSCSLSLCDNNTSNVAEEKYNDKRKVGREQPDKGVREKINAEKTIVPREEKKHGDIRILSEGEAQKTMDITKQLPDILLFGDNSSTKITDVSCPKAKCFNTLHEKEFDVCDQVLNESVDSSSQANVVYNTLATNISVTKINDCDIQVHVNKSCQNQTKHIEVLNDLEKFMTEKEYATSDVHVVNEESQIQETYVENAKTRGSDKRNSEKRPSFLPQSPEINTSNNTEKIVEETNISSKKRRSNRYIENATSADIVIKAFEESSQDNAHVLSEVETNVDMDVIERTEPSIVINDNQDMLKNSPINKTFPNDKPNEEGISCGDQFPYVECKTDESCKYQKEDERRLTSSCIMDNRVTDKNEETTALVCDVQKDETSNSIHFLKKKYNLKDVYVILHKHPEINVDEVNGTSIKNTAVCNSGVSKASHKLDITQITAGKPVYARYSDESAIEGRNIFENTPAPNAPGINTSVKGKNNSDIQVPIGNERKLRRSQRTRSTRKNDTEDLNNENENAPKKLTAIEKGKSESKLSSFHLRDINLPNAPELKIKDRQKLYDKDENGTSIEKAFESKSATQPPDTSAFVSKINNCEVQDSSQTLKMSLPNQKKHEQFNEKVKFNNQKDKATSVAHKENGNNFIGNSKLQETEENNIVNRLSCIIQSCDTITSDVSEETPVFNTPVRNITICDIQVPNENKLRRSQRKRSTRSSDAEKLNNVNENTSTEAHAGNRSNIDEVFESTPATQTPDTTASVIKVNNCEFQDSSETLKIASLSRIELNNENVNTSAEAHAVNKEQFNEAVKFNNQKDKSTSVTYRVEKKRENENNFIGNFKLQETEENNIVNRLSSIIQSCDKSTSNVSEPVFNTPVRNVTICDIRVPNHNKPRRSQRRRGTRSSDPEKLNNENENTNTGAHTENRSNVDKAFESTSATQTPGTSMFISKVNNCEIRDSSEALKISPPNQKEHKEPYNEEKINNQKDKSTSVAHIVGKEAENEKNSIGNFKLQETDENKIANRFSSIIGSCDTITSNVSEQTPVVNTTVRNITICDLLAPNENKPRRSQRKRSTRSSDAEKLNNDNENTSTQAHTENRSNVEKGFESSSATQAPDASTSISKVNNCEIQDSSQTLKISHPNHKEPYNEDKFNNQKDKSTSVARIAGKETENENNSIGNFKLQETDENNIANRFSSIIRSCDTITSNVSEQKPVVNTTVRNITICDLLVQNENKPRRSQRKRSTRSNDAEKLHNDNENTSTQAHTENRSNIEKGFESSSATQTSDASTSISKVNNCEIQDSSQTLRISRPNHKEQYNEEKFNSRKDKSTSVARIVGKEAENENNSIGNFKLQETDENNIANRLSPIIRSCDTITSNVSEETPVVNTTVRNITICDLLVPNENKLRRSQRKRSTRSSDAEKLNNDNENTSTQAHTENRSNIEKGFESSSATQTSDASTSISKVNNCEILDSSQTLKISRPNQKEHKESFNEEQKFNSQKNNATSAAHIVEKEAENEKNSIGNFKLQETDENNIANRLSPIIRSCDSITSNNSEETPVVNTLVGNIHAKRDSADVSNSNNMLTDVYVSYVREEQRNEIQITNRQKLSDKDTLKEKDAGKKIMHCKEKDAGKKIMHFKEKDAGKKIMHFKEKDAGKKNMHLKENDNGDVPISNKCKTKNTKNFVTQFPKILNLCKNNSRISEISSPQTVQFDIPDDENMTVGDEVLLDSMERSNIENAIESSSATQPPDSSTFVSKKNNCEIQDSSETVNKACPNQKEPKGQFNKEELSNSQKENATNDAHTVKKESLPNTVLDFDTTKGEIICLKDRVMGGSGADRTIANMVENTSLPKTHDTTPPTRKTNAYDSHVPFGTLQKCHPNQKIRKTTLNYTGKISNQNGNSFSSAHSVNKVSNRVGRGCFDVDIREENGADNPIIVFKDISPSHETVIFNAAHKEVTSLEDQVLDVSVKDSGVLKNIAKTVAVEGNQILGSLKIDLSEFVDLNPFLNRRDEGNNNRYASDIRLAFSDVYCNLEEEDYYGPEDALEGRDDPQTYKT